jgi:hypothetical protein
MDTKNFETCGIKKIGSRGNQLEEVTIHHLSMNDAECANKKQYSIAPNDKWNPRKQESPQVQENQSSGKCEEICPKKIQYSSVK